MKQGVWKDGRLELEESIWEVKDEVTYRLEAEILQRGFVQGKIVLYSRLLDYKEVYSFFFLLELVVSLIMWLVYF